MFRTLFTLFFITTASLAADPLSLSNLTQEELSCLLQQQDGTELFIPKKTRLTVAPSLTGSVLRFTCEPATPYEVELLEPLFIRIENEELWLSLDGFDWKRFEEIFTGCLSVGLETQGELKIGLNLAFRETN